MRFLLFSGFFANSWTHWSSWASSITPRRAWLSLHFGATVWDSKNSILHFSISNRRFGVAYRCSAQMHSYVEWSSHEPEEGHFDFEGQQDLVRFLRIAHKLGFMVILRPGPYICAERDFVSRISQNLTCNRLSSLGRPPVSLLHRVYGALSYRSIIIVSALWILTSRFSNARRLDYWKYSTKF